MPTGKEHLCVLGAGNGADLDLTHLLAAFSGLTLVDLDEDALNRAREMLTSRPNGGPRAVRAGGARLAFKGGVDVTGWHGPLSEDAGDGPLPPPSVERLAALTEQAPARVAREVTGSETGRAFDVVLSTGLLSQLSTPFYRRFLMSASEWQVVHGLLALGHLSVMENLLKPGGTGLLVVDVASSRQHPFLSAYLEPGTWDDLAQEVQRRAGLETDLETDLETTLPCSRTHWSL